MADTTHLKKTAKRIYCIKILQVFQKCENAHNIF